MFHRTHLLPKFPRCVYSRVVLGLVVGEVLVLPPIGWHRVERGGGECEGVSVGVKTMREMQADASGGI